jgi:hypothetical protein
MLISLNRFRDLLSNRIVYSGQALAEILKKSDSDEWI